MRPRAAVPGAWHARAGGQTPVHSITPRAKGPHTRSAAFHFVLFRTAVASRTAVVQAEAVDIDHSIRIEGNKPSVR
jgi:hypothetical protein